MPPSGRGIRCSTVNPPRLLCVPERELGRVLHLAASFGQRFADLEGDQFGKVLGLLGQQSLYVAKYSCALVGRSSFPVPERLVGGVDGGADIDTRRVGASADDTSGRGIGDLDQVGGFDPTTTDPQRFVDGCPSRDGRPAVADLGPTLSGCVTSTSTT